MQLNMPTPTVNELADANLIESIREHARWQDPCEWTERDGVLLVAGVDKRSIAYKNCVARVDPKVPAAEVLDRARDFFTQRRRNFIVFIRGHRDADLEAALQIQGLERLSNSPCMLIEKPIAERPLPPGIRIERFQNEQQVRDAVRLNAEAYEALGLPANETESLFRNPSRLLSERVIGYVAYRGDQPLSTALTIMSGAGAGAGVYWVGTAKAAERSGLAGLCTLFATNAGFARGAAVVTLQASPFGEPVYQRLGYRGYDRLRWYRYPVAK